MKKDKGSKKSKEKKKSIVEKMKKRIETVSETSNKLFKFIPGEKRRVRFLTDLDDAILVKFHGVWGEFIFPCPKYFGYKDCQYCSGKHDYGRKLKNTEKFALSFFDYEMKEVKFITDGANSFSPIPDLVSYYDEYGTIIDRDYVVKRLGEALKTNYTIIPSDASIFKGRKKYKAMTEKEIFEHLEKINIKSIEEELGYSLEDEEDEIEDNDEEDFDEDDEDDEDDDDEDDEVKPKKQKKQKKQNKNKKKNKKKKKKNKEEDYDEIFDDEEDEEDEEDDFD